MSERLAKAKDLRTGVADINRAVALRRSMAEILGEIISHHYPEILNGIEPLLPQSEIRDLLVKKDLIRKNLMISKLK